MGIGRCRSRLHLRSRRRSSLLRRLLRLSQRLSSSLPKHVRPISLFPRPTRCDTDVVWMDRSQYIREENERGKSIENQKKDEEEKTEGEQQ